MTDPNSGDSDMYIDATLSWAATEMGWDANKAMHFGWMVETGDSEYRTEKAKYKNFPKGSKPKWDPAGGKENDNSAWKWNFSSSQELCVVGGEQECVETSDKSKAIPIWTLDEGTEGETRIRVRAKRSFKPNKNESFLWTTGDVPKKWQFYFSMAMDNKKTYSGKSAIMDLYTGNVSAKFGWYNVGGMGNIEVIIILALGLFIIITSIVLIATKACRPCRMKGEESTPDGAEVGSNATNNEIAGLVEPAFEEPGSGTEDKLAGSARTRRFNRRR